MDLLTATVAQRPDLADRLDDFNPWPRFMHQDPVGSLYYADPVGMYPEFVQVAIDQDHPGELVAKSYSVPFTWDADPASSLPEEGWDGAIIYATLDRLADRRGNLISALEISVRPDLRGSGLSRIMLVAMRANAAAMGFTSLVAPVRPIERQQLVEVVGDLRGGPGELRAVGRVEGLHRGPGVVLDMASGRVRLPALIHRSQALLVGPAADRRDRRGDCAPGLPNDGLGDPPRLTAV